MNLEIGIKSDPIEYRYSFEWLFRLMEELDVSLLQLGSSFELYSVDTSYLHDLRECAASHGVEIRSCFTAHRELGGFFSGDSRLERVAFENYRRWIDVAAAVGARFCGSNPGSLYRDAMESKESGMECYLRNMKELMRYAREREIDALLIEPMSCRAEPPAEPEEIDHMMTTLSKVHAAFPHETVPVYLCGDVSHGVADYDGRIVHDPMELFAMQMSYMAEFHLKNTDQRLDATFGFGDGSPTGIVSLPHVKSVLRDHGADAPVDTMTGYLEISGPKLGREYSDARLEHQLCESIETIQREFSDML